MTKYDRTCLWRLCSTLLDSFVYSDDSTSRKKRKQRKNTVLPLSKHTKKTEPRRNLMKTRNNGSLLAALEFHGSESGSNPSYCFARQAVRTIPHHVHDLPGVACMTEMWSGVGRMLELRKHLELLFFDRNQHDRTIMQDVSLVGMVRNQVPLVEKQKDQVIVLRFLLHQKHCQVQWLRSGSRFNCH